MKLYEIPDYLNKKLRLRSWVTDDYIYFKNGCWYNDHDQLYHLMLDLADYPGWEEYIPAKKKVTKRFWMWAVKYNGHFRILDDGNFYDDSGRSSDGNPFTFKFDWENMIKIKLENCYIDLEVEE